MRTEGSVDDHLHSLRLKNIQTVVFVGLEDQRVLIFPVRLTYLGLAIHAGLREFQVQKIADLVTFLKELQQTTVAAYIEMNLCFVAACDLVALLDTLEKAQMIDWPGLIVWIGLDLLNSVVLQAVFGKMFAKMWCQVWFGILGWCYLYLQVNSLETRKGWLMLEMSFIEEVSISRAFRQV